MERFMDLGGDTESDATERLKMRMELASAYRQKGELEAAHLWFERAGEVQRSLDWAQGMEEVLTALGRGDALAKLWLSESGEGEAWQREEALSRVTRAVEHYRGTADTVGEMQAIEKLLQLTPDHAEARARMTELAAELGDGDTFIAQVRQQLASADSEERRIGLVMRYVPMLRDRFNEIEFALELLTETFDKTPTLALAKLLRETKVPVDGGEGLVVLFSDKSEQVAPEERLAVLSMAAELAEGSEGMQAEAYELYRKILTVEPTQEHGTMLCAGLRTARRAVV